MVSYPAELKKSFFFFFNDTATTEIYTLSLHDALPIFSAERSHILLVFHKRLGRWLQPGGHIEPDDRDTSEAAAREVEEETGDAPRREENPLLVGVDVHEIPTSGREPAHLHHDVVWRVIASAGRL